jgi:predicted transcriptional regulator
MEKRNRDRLDILADILDYCCEPRLTLEIKRHCNLGIRAKEFMQFLTQGGFLKKMIMKNCDIYITTLKGEKFLAVYRELKAMIKEYA